MLIEVRSYSSSNFDREAEYIHRFYIPKYLRKSLQVQDVSAFGSCLNCTSPQQDEGHVIFYREEQLHKNINPETCSVLFAAHDAYQSDCDDRNLSDDENRFLIALNDKLAQLEIDVIRKIDEHKKLLEEEVERGSFVKHFNLDISIEFYLAEDAPGYDDDDDNLLYKINCCFQIPKDIIYGRKPSYDTKPDIYSAQHCQLFHDLFEHSPLPLKHICRIGTIWTDIAAIRQNVLPVRITGN
jgi:hypothetical protein